MSIDLGTLQGAGPVPVSGESEPITGRTHAERKFQDSLVSWANDQFLKMKTGRSRTELQWYLNLAFHFGRQNVVTFDLSRNVSGGAGGISGRLYIPPAPYYRVRQVINKIRPMVNKQVAKLTSQRPTVTVIPASSEDRDIFAAQAGEQIWDSTYRRKSFDVVLERALFWSSITGNGFIKSYWDPQARSDDSDEPGDIMFIQETPFHVFVPDLREPELEYQPFLIHAQTHSPEWVQIRFGGRLQRPLNYDVAAANDILDDSFVNLIGAQDLDRQKAVLVKECWVKPGELPSLPRGGQFTIVGDQIVQGSQGWPYNHNKYPFSHISAMPSGKFYGDSVVTDLITVQREVNRTHSQLIEAKNKMAKPQLLAQEGSVEPSMITSEPGIVIEYKPGYQPPTPLPLSPIPAYVQDELERLYRDFDDISGQHEVSKGSTPPGITAGTAIAFLQEQDDSGLSSYFTSMEKAVQKSAHLTLTYVQQFWTTQRKIKIVGNNGAFDVRAFEGSDLRGNTDVNVESGSALPTSKAARQAFLFDLMKMEFVDPDTGLELMEIGGLNKIYEKLKLDQREAQRENLRMASIQEDDVRAHLDNFAQQPNIQDENVSVEPPLIIPVNSWNNDLIHIEQHDSYRKSQAFEMLPELNRVIFEEHVQAHKINMQVKMMEMPFMQEGAQTQLQQSGLATPRPGTESGLNGETPTTPPIESESQGGI